MAARKMLPPAPPHCSGFRHPSNPIRRVSRSGRAGRCRLIHLGHVRPDLGFRELSNGRAEEAAPLRSIGSVGRWSRSRSWVRLGRGKGFWRRKIPRYRPVPSGNGGRFLRNPDASRASFYPVLRRLALSSSRIKTLGSVCSTGYWSCWWSPSSAELGFVRLCEEALRHSVMTALTWVGSDRRHRAAHLSLGGASQAGAVRMTANGWLQLGLYTWPCFWPSRSPSAPSWRRSTRRTDVARPASGAGRTAVLPGDGSEPRRRDGLEAVTRGASCCSVS
jgi:hypothetical protein